MFSQAWVSPLRRGRVQLRVIVAVGKGRVGKHGGHPRTTHVRATIVVVRALAEVLRAWRYTACIRQLNVRIVPPWFQLPWMRPKRRKNNGKQILMAEPFSPPSRPCANYFFLPPPRQRLDQITFHYRRPQPPGQDAHTSSTSFQARSITHKRNGHTHITHRSHHATYHHQQQRRRP